MSLFTYIVGFTCVLAVMVSSMQLRVDDDKNCVAFGNGTIVDISQVLPYPVNATGPGSNPPIYTYTYDPCDTVHCPGMPDGGAMCQYADFPRMTGLAYKPIYSYSYKTPTQFSVQYVDGFSWRTTIVTFIQDTSVEKPTLTFLSEDPYLQYNLEVRAKDIGFSHM